jgi:hypothetical protein
MSKGNLVALMVKPHQQPKYIKQAEKHPDTSLAAVNKLLGDVTEFRQQLSILIWRS